MTNFADRSRTNLRYPNNIFEIRKIQDKLFEHASINSYSNVSI